MKFSLFTEIQCPQEASPVARLEEFLEQAEAADTLGYRGFMSYYRTIADMRSDYIQWLNDQGIDLPSRLGKTATGGGIDL